MKGTVILIGRAKGYIAVRTDGGLSVIDLLGEDDVEEGDVLSGSLESLGSETIRNERTHQDISVIVEDCHCSEARGRELLGQ